MNTDYSYLNSSSSITSNFQMQLMTMMMQKLSNASSNTGSSSASEFSDLLKIMIPMMAMQTFNMSGDSNNTSGSNLGMGSSVSSMMAPIMMNLMEKLLSENVNSQLSSGGASISQVHINQFSAEKEAGGDGINADCGPTSLAMALHSLGLKVKGETIGSSNGDIIDLARKSMVTDASRDGIDKHGNRLDAEHNTFTNFNDLTRGAEAAGAKARRITPAASSIKNALLTGSKVVASGTFVGKTPLPWTGDSGTDNNKAPGNATKHIIAITGYNQSQDKFVVDDPARKNTLLVTASQLEAFLDGNAGALAISS